MVTRREHADERDGFSSTMCVQPVQHRRPRNLVVGADPVKGHHSGIRVQLRQPLDDVRHALAAGSSREGVLEWCRRGLNLWCQLLSHGARNQPSHHISHDDPQDPSIRLSQRRHPPHSDGLDHGGCDATLRNLLRQLAQPLLVRDRIQERGVSAPLSSPKVLLPRLSSRISRSSRTYHCPTQTEPVVCGS